MISNVIRLAPLLRPNNTINLQEQIRPRRWIRLWFPKTQKQRDPSERLTVSSRNKNNKGDPPKRIALYFSRLNSYFLQSPAMKHQAKAAKAAPMNGPTMKIQSCSSATPPWNKAGAMERAGFTDVPV